MDIDLEKVFSSSRLPDGVKELTDVQKDLLAKYPDYSKFLIAWNPVHQKYCYDNLKQSWHLFQIKDAERVYGITAIENWIFSQIVNLLLDGGIRSMDNKDAMACAKTLASTRYIQNARPSQVMSFFYLLKIGEINIDFINSQNLIVELRKYVISTNEILGDERKKAIESSKPKQIADPPICYNEYKKLKENEKY